ncbi:MAG: thioredoxin domain-containing protein [Epsilonproteobacteria bacterium]|nr:MAG: thioredoxin domain-containing protein [Campylobacterota bacterium]
MSVHGKRGGWPLSVFLSSQQEVLYLATYIPKTYSFATKGLLYLLPTLVQLKADSLAFNNTINKYKKKDKQIALTSKLNKKMMDNIVNAIAKQYDTKNGGFENRPKFPEASKISLLLDIYKLNSNKKAFDMAENTLRKMAQGGIYDQIGGGFFRYTIDAAWQNPHFEKMLYTNAELIAVYVKLYEMTGDILYKKVVDETISQMEKNYMKEGLYLSASDADSDGEEGGYFIYEYTEVKATLKEKGWKSKEIEDALAYLGIEEDGNIDGDFSLSHITSEHEPVRVSELKVYLESESAKRTFPFVDKKINTAWASMMIKALFVASRIASVDNKYLDLAQKRLDALFELVYKNDILYHQVLLGKTPTQKALLEDYAFLIDALIAGYERTYNEKYLTLIQTLTQEALSKFYKNKRWYLSNDGMEVFADFDDRYYTSALSQMLENLVRVSTLTDELKYSDIVKETVKNMGVILETNPTLASKLVHTYLRLEMGDVIIHAKKDKLLSVQDTLDKVTYPFILSQTQESDEYLACKMTMCFAHDKNITKLIEQIKKVIL